MLTSTASHTTPRTRQARARGLCVAAGAAAAAIVWAAEVPLLGVRLTIRFGAMHPQPVAAGQVVGAALAAGLIGWLLLSALDRRTPRARAAWVTTALLVLALSLALPLAAATTTSATIGLIALHLAVGSAVIPGLARTVRPR